MYWSSVQVQGSLAAPELEPTEALLIASPTVNWSSTCLALRDRTRWINTRTFDYKRSVKFQQKRITWFQFKKKKRQYQRKFSVTLYNKYTINTEFIIYKVYVVYKHFNPELSSNRGQLNPIWSPESCFSFDNILIVRLLRFRIMLN